MILKAPAETGILRIVYSESFVDGVKDTKDEYGHGTHVASVIGGNGKKSSNQDYRVRLVGIAPGVNIVNLRALDKLGQGKDSDVIDAIQRAIELKSV